MMQQIQPGPVAATPAASTNHPDSGAPAVEAPPKQVATAMERLSRAARLIADIRIGADRLLEALFLAAESPHQSNKIIQFLVKEESVMRQYFQDLRVLGKQLEDSGVLNGSLKSRGNSWGLHMPLVCPDGAVVAYAWKRQLAGQAGASAVDRTRLALKAFTDQKRRFFPHLEDEAFCIDRGLVTAKKFRGSQGLVTGHRDLLNKEGSVSDIITNLQLMAPDVRIFTYQRLDWLKRASALSTDHPGSSSNEHTYQNSNNLRSGLGNTVVLAADQIAVIELLVPSVFRAVVSLHPAGSMSPEAVAFFSTDEGGNYVHSRGLSVFHVFKHITGHADKALQYFQSVDMDISLSLLLRWICSYRTLFTDACSKCQRLLMMDKSLALVLPPVHRTYQITSATKTSPNQLPSSDKSQSCDFIFAYHIGCAADDT
ncbi:Mediator of RNA polymerase II transcription subunit 27 [Apostasia shenzhenica]|uniref:Mediator of RNA polymerase II transcription subunit 27 n=1 Tax=Apostasia shenzhenica TaxID=1088818 RepID=A0A2I0BGM5_9ASPA|nr:Mediator of RNA polymerase II transcription subunit 27 [Apostasia shenzhenica]